MKHELPSIIKIAGSVGLAVAFVSGCGGGYSTAEQNAMKTSKWEAILSQPHNLGRDMVDCYTNVEPVFAVTAGKAKVELIDAYCVDDPNHTDSKGSLGIPYENPIPSFHTVVDSASYFTNPNLNK